MAISCWLFISFCVLSYSNTSVLLGKHTSTKSPNNYEIRRACASTINISISRWRCSRYEDEQKWKKRGIIVPSTCGPPGCLIVLQPEAHIHGVQVWDLSPFSVFDGSSVGGGVHTYVDQYMTRCVGLP